MFELLGNKFTVFVMVSMMFKCEAWNCVNHFRIIREVNLREEE